MVKDHRGMRVCGIGVLALVAALSIQSAVIAEELTVDGTAAVTVDSTVSLQGALIEALLKQGAPTDFSKGALIAYGIGLLLALGLVVLKVKGGDSPMVVFLADVGMAVNRVYLEKIKPAVAAGAKIEGEDLREAAYAILKTCKGPTLKILEEKGKPWVMAQIHDVANKIPVVGGLIERKTK